MSSQPQDAGPSGPRVAAALDTLSKIQNSAIAFSTRQFQAFIAPQAPKAPTTPHHRAEVQAQSEAAASASQSHPYTPYYRIRGREQTDRDSSGLSAPGSSDRLNTIDNHPPETQALTHPSHAVPAFSSPAPAPSARTPHTPRTLPVVRIFGSGTHAEGVDGALVLPIASPVPASTPNEYPPEAQAPSPPSLPSLSAHRHTLDATTPYAPRTLPVVRIFGGSTRAEGADAALTSHSTTPVKSSDVTMASTPSPGRGRSRDFSPAPSRRDSSRSRSPRRTPPERLHPRSPVQAGLAQSGRSLHEKLSPVVTNPESLGQIVDRSLLENPPPHIMTNPNSKPRESTISFHSNPNSSDEGHLPPAVTTDVDMADTTESQPSASPAKPSLPGHEPVPLPPRPLTLPLPPPLSAQLESMIDRLLAERLNQATIQVVEPSVKLVVEACIRRITDSIALSTSTSARASDQVQNGVGNRDITESDQSDANDDDDAPSKRRKRPRKRAEKNYLHDAFRKYLEEKGVKQRRGDTSLPKSAPPDSVREFNATNDNPPTLSDLAIDWSSSLASPGWNTEVVHLLTVDFQQRLKNGTYPFVVFNEGNMSLLNLRTLCIEKLRRTRRETQDAAKLATTDITARKERRHKLDRMTTRKHGTLARRRRIIDDHRSRDPKTWDNIRQILDRLDIEGISGDETDTDLGAQPKVVRRVALPWLSPVISELFDCVESYSTALDEERMTVHTGNSSLQRIFEPRRADTKAVALDRLPRNWYNEEWYKARSASGRTMLSARKDIPIPTLNRYAIYRK